MHLGGELRVHLGGEFKLQLEGEFIFSIIPVVTLMHCSSSSWKRRSETLGIYHKNSKYLILLFKCLLLFFNPATYKILLFKTFCCNLFLISSSSNLCEGEKRNFLLIVRMHSFILKLSAYIHSYQNCPHAFIHIKIVRMHLS